MTERMTPSEVADLEFQLKAATFQIEACDEQIERQAATIRELEAKMEQATEALIAEQFNAEQGEGLFRAEQAKLKIATEALEPFSRYYDLNDLDERSADDCLEVPVMDLTRARLALARIKEVG